MASSFIAQPLALSTSEVRVGVVCATVVAVSAQGRSNDQRRQTVPLARCARCVPDDHGET